MRILVAGATGAIGRQPVPRLVERGHEVAGTTRSESKVELVRELGATPVVADALDPDAVAHAVAEARPDVIVHQLTAIEGSPNMRHFDRDFAQTRNGTRDIFMNTPNQAAWLERFITDWAGPTARLGRYRFRMGDSVCPGDRMVFTGTVTGKPTGAVCTEGGNECAGYCVGYLHDGETTAFTNACADGCTTWAIWSGERFSVYWTRRDSQQRSVLDFAAVDAEGSLVTSREVLVLGRDTGRTSLIVWFANGASREFAIAVQRDLSLLHEEYLNDLEQALNPPEWAGDHLDAQFESVARYVFWLMDRDRKSTGLKSLQGQIWRQGYVTGELKSQVFPDVPPALEHWKSRNLDVRIFSSGSVLAQKLLFANTEVGDLTRFLGGYFDTNIGPKTDQESYRKIANQFRLPAAKVLFISDMTEELDAAKCAGMQTLLCVRPGNLPQPEKHTHGVISSFSEIVG